MWHNQVQLQIYMWLERILNGNEWEGVFTYVSKDDCTVVSAPIKFNQRIIDEVVIPILDMINDAYEKKDAMIIPVPDPVIYNKNRHQFETNWLCKYCDYHKQCVGKDWVLEASKLVAAKNLEQAKHTADMPHLQPKEKPIISVVSNEPN